jgi:putative salt-induced outer membrane protein YdiY
VSGVATGLWGRGRVDLDGNGTLDDAERASDSVETARRAQADTRYDRFFGERNSVYVLAGGLIDPFAGYDLRTHEQLGYSRHLLQSDKTTVVVELGGDYAQENFVDGVRPNTAQVLSAREMVGVKFSPGKDFGFENVIEAYENVLVFEDVRVNNTAALSAKLNGTLSFKFSHQLRFDNQPVEGFRPVDQTGLVTMVATLL